MPYRLFSYISTLENRFFKNRFATKGKSSLSLAYTRSKITVICIGIHTSPPRKSPPPQLWEVILNILRTIAVTYGRNTKQGLPGGRPQIGPGKIAAGGVLATIFGYLFYRSHLQECPITKRKKFLIFSERRITQMANQESIKIRRQFRGRITRTGEAYRYASGISVRILKANRNLPGIKRDWNVFVIEDRRIKNAFVLPNGDIFIFTGMIAAVGNEDQLAAVIGHEIAHALLNHVGELISKTTFFNLLLLLPIVLIWIMLPDAAAISSENLTRYVSELLFKLPMSRQLETEADVVGLRMMAKACYDPRQAVELWKRMAKMSRGEPMEWLSTHPSHKTRYSTLEKLMPEAMGIYSKHCKT